jgi:hypothetical protein
VWNKRAMGQPALFLSPYIKGTALKFKRYVIFIWYYIYISSVAFKYYLLRYSSKEEEK